MIEEHAEIGRPFQCAGLVNPPAMEMVGLEDTILQNVDGALIHSPSGIMVPVGKDGRVRTHVVCRKKVRSRRSGTSHGKRCTPLVTFQTN